MTYVDTAFDELEDKLEDELEDRLEAEVDERLVDGEVRLKDDDVEDRDEDEIDEVLVVDELATLQPAKQMAATEAALYVNTPIELFI